MRRRPGELVACSARTAPARPRPSRSSRAFGAPTPARSASSGMIRRGWPSAASPGRADAPVRRHRPAGTAAGDDRPVRGLSRRLARSGRAAEQLGLRAVAATPFRRLSGGERQRLAFALALVGRPEVLILDEPTAGMDPEARAAVRAVVAEQRSAGVAILLTSHDLTDVERLAESRSGRGPDRGGGTPSRTDRRRAAAAAVPPGPVPRPRGRRAAGHRGRRHCPADRRRCLAGSPRPGAHARPRGGVADACRAVDRLIVESRTVGGSLEDAYLDLVAREATA